MMEVSRFPGEPYELVQHYCLLQVGNSKAKRQGETKIVIYDLMTTTTEDTTFTFGQYHNDRPVGRWDVFDAHDVFLVTCFYKNGVLKTTKEALCVEISSLLP